MNKATTVRFDKSVHSALNRLSRQKRRPKNKLINDAVALYVEQEAEALAGEAETVLKQIKAYRASDPGFEAAIAAFAEAEGEYGSNNAVEGAVAKHTSSLAKKIHRLVHA